NCKSGYHSHVTPKNITFHTFPLKNPDLLDRWVKNLHRADFVPTKYSRICSLHFTEADFQSERTDKIACRKRSRGDLQKRRLNLMAEPTIFVNLPKYLHTATRTGRSGRASTCKRRRMEEERHEAVVAEFGTFQQYYGFIRLNKRDFPGSEAHVRRVILSGQVLFGDAGIPLRPPWKISIRSIGKSVWVVPTIKWWQLLLILQTDNCSKMKGKLERFL
ncbi:MAG: THAP domain-containing protein, partial [Gammaproteobacteria bacterium]|nr:THAP domain-containing protein [Gammaproteobacteria bacterium]